MVGRIAVGGVDDDLSIASISGLFDTKNVNGNELDKTVTFRNSAGVITITYGGMMWIIIRLLIRRLRQPKF